MGDRSGRWLLALAVAGLAAALGALTLYWVLAAAPNRNTETYGQFARGAMAALEVRAEPPPMPERPLGDAAGGERRLTEMRGQVVLLNVWATWCAPCREEMPTLAALQRAYRDRGLMVAAVSIDSPRQRQAAQTMLYELGGGALSFLSEPTRRIAFDVEAAGFPTTILYDREGRERARLSGRADWMAPEARRLIEAALQES